MSSYTQAPSSLQKKSGQTKCTDRLRVLCQMMNECAGRSPLAQVRTEQLVVPEPGRVGVFTRKIIAGTAGVSDTSRVIPANIALAPPQSTKLLQQEQR